MKSATFRLRTLALNCSSQVVSDRAERATIIMTTNLPFSEWTQVFSNVRLCKALLDRVTDRAHILETGAESYRFRRTLEKRQTPKTTTAASKSSTKPATLSSP